MKKLLFPLLALLAAGPLLAQTPTEDYLRRYNNLVARVGVSGVGVEPLLDKWAADWPDDTNQLLARFYFCFDRCHSAQVIQLDQEKYLGREPILPLKDSLGVVHNYFEDTLYDDALYAASEQALDRILALHPERLDIRLLKISALTQYEKGSPDMALAALKSLVAKHYKEQPQWVYEGVEKVGDEEFCAFMQDYCAAIFRIGSDASAEAFKSLSEHLLKYSKNNPLFMNNIGSYWLVKKDYKKAAKQYDAVVKKHPEDITAIRNGLLTARASKDTKMEKKYLTLMAKYGETEVDRMSAQAKLDAMGKK